MTKLKPCPFCGGEATISDGGYSGEKFLARCRELSCPAASGFIRKTHDEAVAAWNHRAQPENKPLTCEGCECRGEYENEMEYGYPSPCTACQRRAADNYRNKPKEEHHEDN